MLPSVAGTSSTPSPSSPALTAPDAEAAVCCPSTVFLFFFPLHPRFVRLGAEALLLVLLLLLPLLMLLLLLRRRRRRLLLLVLLLPMLFLLLVLLLLLPLAWAGGRAPA